MGNPKATRRHFWEQRSAQCAGLVVSCVCCCLCYHWPWKNMSLGEKGLEVGPGGNSQEVVVGNRAVYVNPVTSRLVRVNTSARVLELSEKSFETGLGNFSLKPTICYRVSDVRQFLENVEDADKFVTSWVLKDVGYFLATSANAQEAATGLQRDHLRFSSLVKTQPGETSKQGVNGQESRGSHENSSESPSIYHDAPVQALSDNISQPSNTREDGNGQAPQGCNLQRLQPLQGAPDPHLASVQQPEYFRKITDDYGIEILWVEFRNTKHKMKRTWDVPETPKAE